jgi:uncharacterized membrane protein YgcG
MSQKPLSSKVQPGRKPAKFSTRSKTVATAVALTALVGGWDWIGHLEISKAEAVNQPTATPAVSTVQPQVQSQVQPTPLPTIRPLSIVAPIPTLAPPSGLLSPEVVQRLSSSDPAFSLRAQTSVAPLAIATLAPLPSLPPMPSLPPLPSNNDSNSGNSNGGGSNSNSGGGGGGGGSQKSGGS